MAAFSEGAASGSTVAVSTAALFESSSRLGLASSVTSGAGLAVGVSVGLGVMLGSMVAVAVDVGVAVGCNIAASSTIRLSTIQKSAD